MANRRYRDTNEQNWEDSWVENDARRRRKDADFVTTETPYFRPGLTSYSAKPLFFGASVVYFFARLFSPVVKAFQSLFGRNKIHPSPTTLALKTTDTTLMCAASHKIAKPLPMATYRAKPVAEEPRQKFEDEGVVYRP